MKRVIVSTNKCLNNLGNFNLIYAVPVPLPAGKEHIHPEPVVLDLLEDPLEI